MQNQSHVVDSDDDFQPEQVAKRTKLEPMLRCATPASITNETDATRKKLEPTLRCGCGQVMATAVWATHCTSQDHKDMMVYLATLPPVDRVQTALKRAEDVLQKRERRNLKRLAKQKSAIAVLPLLPTVEVNQNIRPIGAEVAIVSTAMNSTAISTAVENLAALSTMSQPHNYLVGSSGLLDGDDVIIQHETIIASLINRIPVHHWQGLAKRSQQTYSSDIRMFVKYMASSWPEATPEEAHWRHILSWLQFQVSVGVTKGCLQRRLGVICKAFPTMMDHAVHNQWVDDWKGLQDSYPSDNGEIRGKHPFIGEKLELALSLLIGTSMETTQQRLFLVLAYQACLRRSEMYSLRWQNISFQPEGIVISTASKTGPKVVHVCSRIGALDCVALLSAWKQRCALTEDGFVFHTIRNNRILAQQLSIRMMLWYVKSCALSVDEDPDTIGCHSLISGKITTEVVQNGVELSKMMAHSQHRSLQGIRSYVKPIGNLLHLQHDRSGFAHGL